MTKLDLEKAYLATTYTCHSDQKIFEIKIGKTAPELNRWLKEKGIESWAIITAANPHSQALGKEENSARNEQFERHLKYLGIKKYYSEGVPADGNWEIEIGFFLIDIELKTALKLAKSVEQNAIVFWEIGKAIRLVWL